MKKPSYAPLLRALNIAALTVTALGGAACSSAEEPAQPSEVDAVRAKLAGQSIAVVPFDSENPECTTNPYAMDKATVARCIHLDPAHIPASMEVTSELMRFDPKAKTGSILVLQGPPLDPAHADSTMYAFIGLDIAKGGASSTGLVKPREAATLVASGGAALIDWEALAQTAKSIGLSIAKPIGVVGSAALDVALLALLPSNMNVTEEQVAMMENRLVGERVKVIDGLAERPAAGGSRPPQYDPWCRQNIPTGYTKPAQVDAYWARCPNGVNTTL
jgi:hypothetical protein